MHPHARIAIRAAQHRNQWGHWATIRYLQKRSIPLGLFTLARVLETSKRAGL